MVDPFLRGNKSAPEHKKKLAEPCYQGQRNTQVKKFREFPGGPAVRLGAFTAVAWVQSLVGELRSHKPCDMAKKKKEKKLKKKMHRPVLLRSIDEKTLNKILANSSQQGIYYKGNTSQPK